MRLIGYRQQRTTERPAELRGVGFITGTPVRVRFLPAPADSGVVFRRVDLPGGPVVAARAANVTGTQRRTTLGPPAQGITLVEHLLAALAGLRIDNCTVELDGPEPPGLDGSAAGFVETLFRAGAVVQAACRPIYSPTQPVVLSANGATIALHPGTEPGLRASYILDYGLYAPIPRQVFTLEVRPENFVREVALCRTFLTDAEAHALRSQGVGRHLTAAEVLVFGDRGPIENRLRFADEPARHKVLDMIGDLALCGFDLAGHVVAYRSGHAMNVELAGRLAASPGGASSFPVIPSSCRPANRRAA
jgi:UDP-3-O-acyl N-acetylglucosamine deacetylase